MIRVILCNLSAAFTRRLHADDMVLACTTDTTISTCTAKLPAAQAIRHRFSAAATGRGIPTSARPSPSCHLRRLPSSIVAATPPARHSAVWITPEWPASSERASSSPLSGAVRHRVAPYLPPDRCHTSGLWLLVLDRSWSVSPEGHPIRVGTACHMAVQICCQGSPPAQWSKQCATFYKLRQSLTSHYCA